MNRKVIRDFFGRSGEIYGLELPRHEQGGRAGNGRFSVEGFVT